MSALAKLGIRPSGWFVLRTPALAYDEFLAWGCGKGEAEVLRDRLRRAVARPEVREAVFVASPRVAELVQGWLDGSEVDRKVEQAVVRYFTRMTGRATPFGLFAGTSCGRLAGATSLEVGAMHTYRRRTRLDMEYLSTLVVELERDPELRSRLEFRPNSSLYSGAGRLRYAEARIGPSGRVHHLVAVESHEYLDATLKRASGGARPDDLAAALVDDDISLDEVRDFVAELIDTQMLVSELAPPVTGPEPLEVVIATLARHRADDATAAILTHTRDALHGIDARGIGVDREDYLAVARALRDLPAPVELNRLFQVDLTKPAERLSLGPRVVEEVARGLEILRRLSPPPDRENPLSRFRRTFTERYGDREVPLVEALDEEIGIGFEVSSTPTAEGSPLLEGLTFEAERDELAPWRWRDQWLLTKVVEANRMHHVEIALSSQDVDDVGADPRPLPEAFSVIVTIAARSGADVDRGDFRVLLGGSYGPSGGRLIGRFCHSDPQQHRLLQEHLRQEEALHPDAVYAEIVHLPEGRLGNILLRPVLRDYEIPYLGRSGVPEERQIPVQDLRLSVRDDRIHLRSAKLDKEVRPRLTTAHNYSWRSLGIYRFLCALQAQGTAGGVMWDWGVLDGSPFLPRVRVGKTVLSRATWLLTKNDLSELRDDSPEAWAGWREARSIPRFVALVDADHELIVDWHNPLSVLSFLAIVRRRPWARLIEVWPDPDELVVTGPEGRFRHEMVIPFVRIEPATAPAAAGAPGRHVHRSFPPGTEWLYLKLYTGTATADVVLRDHVGPVVRGMVSEGLADRWFFIRYGDPHWHLRLRIHGDPAALTGEALPRLQERASRLLQEGLVWNVQLDTYVREVERYGGAEAIEIAERLFAADSEAALALVESLAGDAGMDARWRLTLQSVHLLFDDFGFALDERSRIVRALRDSYAAEFGSSAELKRQIGRRYREEKQALEALLADPTAVEPAPAAEALGARAAEIRPLVAELRALEERIGLSRELADIASSLVHMTANRLLRSAARAQEMVIYDLLDRLYLARANRGAPPRR
jgi:thiopeptide-type bacteriocin biosynthesis protein